MSITELIRRPDGKFYFEDGTDCTDLFYSGTHQIILTGFCQELAFEALEGVAQQFQILVHDDNCRCYVVVPGISEEQFFTEIVSVVDHAVGGVDISEGEYSIRRKIPPSPKLPQGISDAKAERISGEICRKATIHFGRGYGHRFSKV